MPTFGNRHSSRRVTHVVLRTLTLATVVLAASLLAACGDDREGGQPPLAATSPSASTPPPQPGFGGVIEVTFLTDDATTQDRLASACGLSDGRRAGLAAYPLLPSVRWYADPADPEAAIGCMERHEAVRRVLRPL